MKQGYHFASYYTIFYYYKTFLREPSCKYIATISESCIQNDCSLYSNRSYNMRYNVLNVLCMY